VAVISAVVAPLLVLAMGLGIDVSFWMATRLQLQRMADLAAMAGAAKYASRPDASSALITAANVAELNGFPAALRTTAPNTPSTGTNTLSESYNVWSGSFASNSNAQLVTVTLQRQVPRFFSAAVLTSKPIISVTAAAQVVPRPGVGQACVLALQGYSSGVTTADDITGKGNAQISLSGCDMRADASMVFKGNTSVAVPNLIASGTVTGITSNSCPQGQVCDNKVLTQQPQIPDPFSGTYGGLLTSIPTNTTSQPSGNTLSPPPTGTAYTSLDFSGDYSGANAVTFNPGVYYVSGSVTFHGNGDVVGQGVTIISGGGITFNGSTNVTLTAPTSGQTAAGLLFGTNSPTASVLFNGNSSQTLRGAIYTPNTAVTINGNSDTGKSACLTIVANSVTFSGNSALTNSGCAAMGVPAVSDQPGIARLVQ
jgi:Flp pilus assembly protein TadG